jgi:hypothetical protein
MTVTESRSADRTKVRFPPPKTWDPEAKWTQECVMFRICSEKHPPGKCDAFKKLSPQQRLKEIDRAVPTGLRTKYPTAVSTVVRRLTIPSCTAHLWRAALWSCRG